MKIEQLKKELEEAKNDKFLLGMQSHWEHRDFERDSELSDTIKKLIAELEKKGIKVKYEFGYPLEYEELEK